MLAREDENGASESLLPSKAASPLRQPSARRARSERNRVEHNDTSAVSQRTARPPSHPPKHPSMPPQGCYSPAAPHAPQEFRVRWGGWGPTVTAGIGKASYRGRVGQSV